MFKATSLLIDHRQKFSKSTLKVVKVKNIGGGNANNCFQNAVDLVIREKSKKVVSGWIVVKLKSVESIAFLSHFWNSDAQGNYFDTTPHSYDRVYVLDIELLRFSHKHIKNIKSRVVCPILLQNGILHLISANGSIDPYKIITSLHPKNLFQFN